jgi:hypothetical protein
MKGLSGAALFGDFFLLLRKRHSRTCTNINYEAFKALCVKKIIRRVPVCEAQLKSAGRTQSDTYTKPDDCVKMKCLNSFWSNTPGG